MKLWDKLKEALAQLKETSESTEAALAPFTRRDPGPSRQLLEYREKRNAANRRARASRRRNRQ